MESYKRNLLVMRNTRGLIMRAILVFLVVLWVAIPEGVFAEGYLVVGGGGGEEGALHLTFELQRISTDRDYNSLLSLASLGVVIIFNADNIPSGTLEYPVPHSDYKSIGTKQKGNEFGILGKYGLDVGKRIFVFGLTGLSIVEEIELVQSNVTEWYYEQSSKTTLNGLYGVGLAFIPTEGRIFLEAGYDNRRSVTGSIGYRW